MLGAVIVITRPGHKKRSGDTVRWWLFIDWQIVKYLKRGYWIVKILSPCPICKTYRLIWFWPLLFLSIAVFQCYAGYCVYFVTVIKCAFVLTCLEHEMLRKHFDLIRMKYCKWTAVAVILHDGWRHNLYRSPHITYTGRPTCSQVIKV